MKSHPRIRKTIKWGGAAVTVLLVVVWVWSGSWLVAYHKPALGLIVGVGQGRIALGTHLDMQLRKSGFSYERLPWFWMEWAPEWWSERARWRVIVPLWTLAVPVSLAAAVAWRLDTLARRRAKGGLDLCPKCGYDRTGLASKDAKCPECGSSPS